MKLIRNALMLPALLLMANAASPLTENKLTIKLPLVEVPVTLSTVNCYAEWNLTAAGLSYEVFNDAVKGYK